MSFLNKMQEKYGITAKGKTKATAISIIQGYRGGPKRESKTFIIEELEDALDREPQHAEEVLEKFSRVITHLFDQSGNYTIKDVKAVLNKVKKGGILLQDMEEGVAGISTDKAALGKALTKAFKGFSGRDFLEGGPNNDIKKLNT